MHHLHELQAHDEPKQEKPVIARGGSEELWQQRLSIIADWQELDRQEKRIRLCEQMLYSSSGDDDDAAPQYKDAMKQLAKEQVRYIAFL